MKRKLTVFFSIFVLTLTCLTAAAWAEKFSCDDLTGLANALDDIAVAFENAGTISEGDVIDTALGEIVDAVIMVAEVENEGRLNTAVDRFVKGYNNMDADMFSLGLDSVITNLDRLYNRDCQ